MNTTIRLVAHTVGSILLVVGVAVSLEAAPRQAVPRSGGAGPRATAPSRRVGTAPRPASPRGQLAARGTAGGVARYGHGHGGPRVIAYPWWDGWSPWWGAGWYGGWWGWPGYSYGYGYAGYGPWYGPYDSRYSVSVEAVQPHGPAIVETGVSPSNAEVVLDGESVGFASDYNGRWDKLSVPPGPHSVAFRARGYRTLVIDFDARPGATYVFSDALVSGEGEERRTIPSAVAAATSEPRSSLSQPKARGRLRVRAEPPDAAVYLDGEYLGLGAELARTHGALAVPTGSHRLEAARPGYVSTIRTIDVGETELATVEITLEPEH